MPLDRSSGITQSGTISMNGSGTKSTDGTHAGTNIAKEFYNKNSSDSIAMSDLHRDGSTSISGGPVTGSDINISQGLPTSGQISMSQFYKTSNAVDPTDLLTETVYGKANLQSDNANGGYTYGRGGSNQASTSFVQYSTSMSNVFTLGLTGTSGGFSSGLNFMQAGFDMMIRPTYTRGKVQTNIQTYHLSWFVKPHGTSSTYTPNSGSNSTVNTSTWTEIYRMAWPGNQGDFDSSFTYAPTFIRWSFAEYTVSSMDNMSSTWSNDSWETNGASGYNMIPSVHNGSTTYTFGDGDGPYSATAASSWIGNTPGGGNGVDRGARLTFSNLFECETGVAKKRYAMNFILEDVASSLDGSNYANTSLQNAGLHSFTSPTFVFEVGLTNYHSGTCNIGP
tara:strand:+ start:19848 stop:21026 length:1179 start_codon:yes stop_codon:yes gene_type:complete